jgi:GntR family transcriptional regulator
MKIEREVPVPLYYRLAEIVKQKILNSEFEVGESIPTEAELEKEYGVSRITVRQAIDLLCRQGFLVKERGKTPYVARSKLEHTFGPISSFTKNIRSKGLIPGTKVLSLCYTKPPRIVARHFEVKEEDDVILLKRLRLVNGEPVAIDNTYLQKDPLSQFVEKGISQESLYESLERDYGILLDEIDETIQVQLAGKEESKLLKIKVGFPCLLSHRIVRDVKGKVVAYSRTIYRGDEYKYHARLKGRVSRGKPTKEVSSADYTEKVPFNPL